MHKNSNLVLILCVAAGFLGICFIGGGIGVYLLVRSSGDASAKTTWADVLKERATSQAELEAEFQRVRDANNGRIPPPEQVRLSSKLRQHDDHLAALEQLASRTIGPPPPEVAQVMRKKLSTVLYEEFNRSAPTPVVGGPPAMPPGAYPPGAYPPGAFPPGAMPPGAVPFGAMPPGAMPPGAMPPGAGPPGFGPGGVPGGIDVEAMDKMQKKALAGAMTAESMKEQQKEADRIKELIQGYYKNANPSEKRGEQTMVQAQRELVKAMLAHELTLRKKELSTDERLALFEEQGKLEQSFREIGAEEGRRLAVLKKEADEKERQRQEVAQKEAAETARLAREAQLRELGKINAESQARSAKIAEEHAKKMAEINREYDEKLKKAEMIRFMEAVNKQRATKGLAPLTEMLKPITASILDKEAAPGTEVKDVKEVKPKDRVYAHTAGKWHDATVKTKRGIYVEVMYVALENTETVTVDRLRLQGNRVLNAGKSSE